MSSIETYLQYIASKVWARDVRTAIVNAIRQCYDDVHNPTLNTEALQAAIQAKIDAGQMAALTIGDRTITAAKLALGVIPTPDTTLSQSGVPADAKTAGDEITAIKANLGALTKPQRLADGTDLDTVLTPGVYMLYANNSYLHKPTADSEHGILEVLHEDFGDNTGRTFQRLTYTYKAGRTYIEIWVRTYSALTSTWSVWISATEDLSRKLMLLSESLQSQTGVISKVNGSYIDLITDPVSLTPVVNAEWSHSIVSCAEGDTFIINADGGQRPRAWGFLDSGNHVLSVADASTVVEDLELTAPTNAVKLIINDKSGAVSYIPSAFLLTKIAESAQGKVDVQQSPSDYGKALIINRDGQVRPGVVSGGSGLTDNAKVALLACFRHVHWDDEHSVDYYDALEAALYAAESRLTAVIDYGNATLFTDDPLAKVRWMTKVYYDGVEISPRDCTFTGNLIAGQNVLTITYNDESTTIMVEAEEKPASRLVLTAGDILKFDGLGMSSGAGGHQPPYLVSDTTGKTYYTSKGHAPYKDENNNLIDGKYPIPIPAFATHVRVSVAPNTYKVALNCWKYNNSTYNYSYIANTDTGFTVYHAETDVAQYESNARAVNVLIMKPDESAFDALSEPTQVVIQFS